MNALLKIVVVMSTDPEFTVNKTANLPPFLTQSHFHFCVFVAMLVWICIERWCFASLNNYNNAGCRLYTGGGIALVLFTLMFSLCTFNNDSERVGHYQTNAGENAKILNEN